MNLNNILTDTDFTLTNQTSDFSYTVEIMKNTGGSPDTQEVVATQTVNVTLT